MNMTLRHLVLVLGTLFMETQASAQIISVTDSGTITQVPSGLTGISVGTPYRWQATYDSLATPESLPDVGFVFSPVLTTRLTIGNYSWTATGVGGSPYMAVQCCQGQTDPDYVSFWANPVTGAQFDVSGLTYAPQAINDLFSEGAVGLPSNKAPTAQELASFYAQGVDLRMHSTTTAYDEFDVVGGSARQVTITPVPEPRTTAMLFLGLAGIFLRRLLHRAGRPSLAAFE